jgi:hypothetical protein
LGVLLLDWMWAQRPPLPVTTLAAQVGVERTTLVSWLTTNRQPQPLQLLLLAQVTELPVADLAAAADVQLERVLKQRAVLFDYVCWELGRSGVIVDDEHSQVVAFLQNVRDAPGYADDTFSPGDDARGDRMADAAAEQSAGVTQSGRRQA